MTYENHWQRRTFDSGTRRRRALGEPPAVEAGGLTDRVESKVTPPPTHDEEIRRAAFDDAVRIASLYEKKGAPVSALRWALEAARDRKIPLEEAPQPGRASGASSSGATGTNGMPSSPPEKGDAPLDSSEERDLWLIARGFDMAFRALGIREPQSIKADAKPNLRVVE